MREPSILTTKNPFREHCTDVEISHTALAAHPKSAIQIRNSESVDQANLILHCIEREKDGA